MSLSEKFEKMLDEVMLYAGPTKNWLAVKKELLYQVGPCERSLFSRRHESTRKHILNDFEKSIVTYWLSKTGTLLEIPTARKHPTNWTYHEHGWGLKLFNEQRRKRKNEEK